MGGKMVPWLFCVLFCVVVSVTWGVPERGATIGVWRGLEQCAHTIVIPKTDPEVCPGGRDTVVFLQITQRGERPIAKLKITQRQARPQPAVPTAHFSKEELKNTVDDVLEWMKKAKVKLRSLDQMVKDDQLEVFSSLTKVLLQEQEHSKQIQLLKEEIESLKQSCTVQVNVSEPEHSTLATTGVTSEETTPTAETTERPVTEIKVTRDSWTEYDFAFEDNWNACHGKQYVKLTGWAIGKYVGVVLCSATRYKIFLSQELGEMFRNVADGSGHGADHCEFLGVANDATELDSDFWDSPSTEGYCRSNRGERLRYGRIGGTPGTDEWTGCYYPHWYECGISVP